MKRAILSLLLAAATVVPALAQCGPWGCPSTQPQQPNYRQPADFQPPTSGLQSTPTPAWRYAQATGHRRAVVRIHCWAGGGTWYKGSGVLVRWGRRKVVITARHVVRGAKRIIVDFPGRRRCRKVTILLFDDRWDCCALQVGDLPKDIEPVEFAFGEEARFRGGERLVSCGYGPDGRLAVNRGLFKGYRRSSKAPDQGPDDWMVISGRARQGDSGGPVFDSKGRVVGVLWGTDGREVVCVQAGRLTTLLTSAVKRWEQMQMPRNIQRKPTPARPPRAQPEPELAPVDPAKIAGGRDRTLLPWRKEAEAKDKQHDRRLAEQDRRIGRLIDLAERMARNRRGANVDVDISAGGESIKDEVDVGAKRSPLLAGLFMCCGVAAGFVVYFAARKD